MSNEKINCAHSEIVEIHKIVPNPKNPNKHSDKQIERLAKIIDYQGQRSPIVISTLSGFVVKGHGRLMAMEKLEWEHVAVDYQDYESEAQEYADIVADNAIAEWSELDLELIGAELKDMDFDLDLDLLGLEDFGLPEVEVLPSGSSGTDSIPEINHPISRRGDVWILGNHRLMCGDSTMIDDVEKLMNGKKADMVFTDPPYGIEYKSNWGSNHESLENDDTFLDFLPCLEIASKEKCPWFIWTTQKVYPKWREMYENYYQSTIVWFKRGGGMGNLKGDYAPDYEMALFCKKGKVEFKSGRPGAVWEVAKDSSLNYVHPTQKPVELAEYAISHFFNEDDSGIILDLFLGSGSTLIASERKNKSCYGMEISEKYCDTIIKRWEGFTGQKAILEQTNQTYEELKLERQQ